MLRGEKCPPPACIRIPGDEQHGVAARAVSAGASGFIPKSFTADEMIVATQKGLAGDVVGRPTARPTAPAGPWGFTPKSFTADEMIVAIQKVLAGDVFVPATADLTAAPDTNGLTLRPLEVISMPRRGVSQKKDAAPHRGAA